MKNELFCLGVAIVFLTRGTLTLIEPDADMLEWMSQVKNISDWCELMNMDDCEQVIEDAVSSVVVDESGEKIVVSGDEEPEVALFDACNPRELTVAIPRHPDPEITVWPPCTRVMRCGGCCTSDVFSCEPTAISERFFKVFDTRLPYPGAHRFKFVGVRVVRILEHLHCDAQCKTKEHECHKYQKYDSRRCQCFCRSERLQLKTTCSEGQIWDDNECDCICPNRNTIKCPDPSYFSSATCKCTLKMGVSGEIDLEKLFEQLDKGNYDPDILLNSLNNDVDNETNIFTGNIIDETEGTEGGDDSKDNGGTNGKWKGKNEDESGDQDGDSDEKTTLSQSSSSTSTSTSTTTTAATTTTPTTLPPVTTTCTPPRPCFGNWVPTVMKHSGVCQCMPKKFGRK